MMLDYSAVFDGSRHLFMYVCTFVCLYVRLYVCMYVHFEIQRKICNDEIVFLSHDFLVTGFLFLSRPPVPAILEHTATNSTQYI